MNELALFAGAGGGILGGHLLGWRCVCAVEYNAYARSVLLARQNDGTFPPFPVWDDIRTFDGIPWRGNVDIVSGGFPCQDISTAGKGAGIAGKRSGLWKEMRRVVCEVRPRFVYVENSPALTGRGLGVVLGDLAALGYDAEWGVLSAQAVGAPHLRERIWILARYSDYKRESIIAVNDETPGVQELGDSNGECFKEYGAEYQLRKTTSEGTLRRPGIQRDGDSWPPESGLGRVAYGVANRRDRLKAIGNGQVPRVAASAFIELYRRLNT